jgi:sec-independent protein translocase protein TatA
MHGVLGEIVGWEFLLVIAVAALLFGSSQIPKLAKSMGQASKEFRKGLEEGSGDDESSDAAESPKSGETPKPSETPKAPDA